MIAIIDYGSGNIGAIANIHKQLGIPHLVTQDPQRLADADRFILPGVGAFDATMKYFNQSGIVDVLNEQVMAKTKKVLGICVGMQILADSSEEGTLPGLGWIPGRIRKIDEGGLSCAPKLPHMGWNSVAPRDGARLFDGVDCGRGFYFLHSYYFDARDATDVTAIVEYGKEMPCAVARKNVFGVQFHPEKSHANGACIFRNFAEL
jgi:imidazole glycerol-phosphate synthase subunit HisH